MGRPSEVQVFAPTTWFVGQPATIEIEIVTKDETKVDFIDVFATGTQGWAIGSGDSRVSAAAKFPALAARVMEGGVLPAGRSRFEARFLLPPGTPPTHEVAPAYARLELFVHVSIPWWIDGRYRFQVPVRIPPPVRVERTPVMVRSETAATKPRLELSLASARLIVGEALVGSCALFHVDDRKQRDLDIRLVPSLKLLGRGRTRERRGTTYNISIPIPPGSAGTSVPFQFRLPDAMVPSFSTATHQLGWSLVASYGSFFGGREEVGVALEIVDASAAATTARLQVAPRLADQRVMQVFERFASRAGWAVATSPGGLGADEMPVSESYVTSTQDDTELGIGYSYRGKDGTFLVARVAHPSLGLDLSVTPSSSLRHVFFRDIEIDLAAWDRAHLVAARSVAQTTPFLKAAAPAALEAIRQIGPLVRWDDDALVLERQILSVEEPELARIAGVLVQLATVIPKAREAISTPPEMIVDAAAMRELAARWKGRFTPGDVSIQGMLDNAPIDLGLAWDAQGKPAAVRASVGSPNEASEQARAVSFVMVRPAADALAASTPEALVEKLTAWPSDIRDLHVHDGVVSASLALETTAGAAPPPQPVVDAARVRELVELLRAVLAALAPQVGPYR